MRLTGFGGTIFATYYCFQGMRHYNGSESCGFVFTPVNITLFRLPRRGLPRPAGLPRPGLPRPAGLPRPCSYFTPRLPHRQATTPPSYIIPQATTPAGLPRPSLYPVDTGYHTCLVCLSTSSKDQDRRKKHKLPNRGYQNLSYSSSRLSSAVAANTFSNMCGVFRNHTPK